MGQRLGIIACQRAFLKFRAKLGCDVCRDGNAANAAVGVKAQCGRVFTRQLHKISAAMHALLGHAGQIACRIFDADDHRQFGQFAHRFWCHVHDRTAWNVVDHNRQTTACGSRKMGDQTRLGRLVIIGGHDQCGIGACLFGGLDQTHGFHGVVGPCTRDHGNASGGGLYHGFHDQIMLGVGQRRAFAGCADWDKAVAALIHMPVDQFFQRICIHFAVRERRDKCRQRPFEHDALPYCRWP